MKTIDRYIIRELALPILYIALTLIGLILIADLFDNLDDILRNKTSFARVLKYYLAMIPYAYTLTIAWAAWLGSIFLLVNFGFHNEILAMKVAGLKITTIVRPIFFIGFMIGIATFLVSDRVVPRTYRYANEILEVHIEKRVAKEEGKVFRNVTYSAGGNQLYFFRTFSRGNQKVEDAIILWLDRASRSTRQKMVAKSGVWKESEKAWEFDLVTEYQMDSRGRILGEPQHFPKKIYPEINVSPRDLSNASSESSFLSYRELKRSLKTLKENGVKIASESVDLHHRLSAPWQSLVMMMIAIPLLVRTRSRKVIAMNVLYCLGLVFVFHVTGAMGLALGKAGKLFPFLSAWLANIAFGVGALIHLEKGNF